MKPKVMRGGGFRGVLEYICGDGKSPDIVGGNMSGTTPRQLAAEFGVSRQARSDVQRPVWHCSLSLPAGETVTADKWRDIAADMVRGMGMDTDNHQFVAVRHSDTDYDHIHIAASRIGLDGKIWYGKHEARVAINLAQDLEKKHGLEQTQGYYKKEAPSLKNGEYQMGRDKEPPRLAIRRLVNDAIKKKPTAVEFAERLEAAGVGTKVTWKKGGEVQGISFIYEGIAFRGSKVHEKQSWPALLKRGMSYDDKRDRARLEQFAERAEAASGDKDGSRIAEPVIGNQPTDQPDQRDDRTANSGQPGSHERNEPAPVVGSAGRNDQASRDGIRQTDSGAGRPDQNGDRIDGHDQRPGQDRVTQTDRGDDPRAEATGGTGQQSEQPGRAGRGGQPAGREAGPERGDSRPQHRQADAGGHGVVGLGGLAGDLRDLADRHVITLEKAREAIDTQIAKNPAPARPAGRKAPTGRLSRWFSSTKSKLAKFIEKARDYFNDAAVTSAGKGGWSPDEVRSAGLSGDLLNRAKALQLQAEEAAEKARVKDQAERLKRTAEAPPRPPEMPQEPGIELFDDDNDDEPQGPGPG